MKYKRKNITLQESIKILREWECAVKRGHWSKDNHELADAIYIVLNTLESLMEIEIDKCNEKGVL